MYINPQVLDKKQHRDLKFKPVNDFSFAAQTVSVPLLWDEISAAARCYPIVFPLAETHG
ncbi:MAG: SapC family protein [Desulfuromonas sp.]